MDCQAQSLRAALPSTYSRIVSNFAWNVECVLLQFRLLNQYVVVAHILMARSYNVHTKVEFDNWLISHLLNIAITNDL